MGKKTLYLLRHAKSEWNKPFASDWERDLNERGKRDILIMSSKLEALIPCSPDIVLSSDSVRTMLTIKQLTSNLHWDENKVFFDKSLYLTSVEALKSSITSLDDSFHSVMCVGHNPTHTMLVNHLSDARIENLPTCSCVGIEFDINTWRKVGKENAKILFVEYPKK